MSSSVEPISRIIFDDVLAHIASGSGDWHIKINDRCEIIEINGHPLEGADTDGNE